MQMFTGRDYLKIDIASNFGLDKKTWDERLDWFEANEHQLAKLTAEAANPGLYYAGLQAWQKAQRKEISAYPISLDATASGIQLLACLSNCYASGIGCNLVNTGKRMDAYTYAFEGMVNHPALINSLIRVERDDVKRALMTSFYNSKAVPKEVFGEGTIQLATFYAVAEQLFPGAWQLNQLLTSLWRPDALSHDWVLPDNFHVKVKVMDTAIVTAHFGGAAYDVQRKVNRATQTGRSLPANITHSIDGMVVREMLRRCSYDLERVKYLLRMMSHPRGTKALSEHRPQDQQLMAVWRAFQRTGFLSARVLDLIDDRNRDHVDPEAILWLISTLPKTPFQVVTVHD